MSFSTTASTHKMMRKSLHLKLENGAVDINQDYYWRTWHWRPIYRFLRLLSVSIMSTSTNNVIENRIQRDSQWFTLQWLLLMHLSPCTEWYSISNHIQALCEHFALVQLRVCYDQLRRRAVHSQPIMKPCNNSKLWHVNWCPVIKTAAQSFCSYIHHKNWCNQSTNSSLL